MMSEETVTPRLVLVGARLTEESKVIGVFVQNARSVDEMTEECIGEAAGKRFFVTRPGK